MKVSRFILSLVIISGMITGCSSTTQKSETKEKVIKKVKKKKPAKVAKQDVVTLPDTTESKPVVDSGISAKFSDDELIAYANDHLDDYWHTYYCFMAGTYFEGTGEWGQNLIITDPNIHSLQDIENVWYQKFSRRYPAPYMDMNINLYKETPFWKENGQVHERDHIDGIIAHSLYFDHITQKSDDEVWFALYSTTPDNKIHDWNQEWSFVYENGQLMYGTIVRND